MDKVLTEIKQRLESAGYMITSACITQNVTICRAMRKDGRSEEVVASSLLDGMAKLMQRLGL